MSPQNGGICGRREKNQAESEKCAEIPLPEAPDRFLRMICAAAGLISARICAIIMKKRKERLPCGRKLHAEGGASF